MALRRCLWCVLALFVVGLLWLAADTLLCQLLGDIFIVSTVRRILVTLPVIAAMLFGVIFLLAVVSTMLPRKEATSSERTPACERMPPEGRIEFGFLLQEPETRRNVERVLR